jgi:phosphoglycolate phosphatase
MKKIRVLWDIDGTLLTTNGAGAPGMKAAIQKILDADIDFDLKRNSGKTDFEIIQSYLEEFNLASDDNITRAISEYVSLLETALEIKPAIPLANVRESLDMLRAWPDVSLEICSGNVYPGAQLKLASAGLWDYFRESRFWTPTILKRTRREVVYSSTLGSIDGKILIIGDSPADFYAAKGLDLAVLLIPSGHHSKNELNIGASYLFDPDWLPATLEALVERLKTS